MRTAPRGLRLDPSFLRKDHNQGLPMASRQLARRDCRETRDVPGTYPGSHKLRPLTVTRKEPAVEGS
jgi:hypothetical protein